LIAHDDGALDQVRREVEERGGSALLGLDKPDTAIGK